MKVSKKINIIAILALILSSILFLNSNNLNAQDQNISNSNQENIVTENNQNSVSNVETQTNENNNVITDQNNAKTNNNETTNEENGETENTQQQPSQVETTDNRVKGQSIFQTIKHGGVLMIFLIIMGLISFSIIVERIIFYTRYNVWKNDHMVSHLKEIADNSKASCKEELENELRYVFQVYSNKLERGLSLLSGLGNLAPVVGFLGTVIGMIGAFSDIMLAASVNAKVVAGGIKVALVTTAGGLIVAAPTLAFFYFFMHVIHEKFSKAEEVIGDFSECKKSFLEINNKEN